MHCARRGRPPALHQWSIGLLWMLLVASVAQAGSDDSPGAWVARMNEALVTRNYDGVFVHRLGRQQETLHIIHRVRDGQVSERIISTDGSGREFVRKGQEWLAYFPERRIVVVERRMRNGFIIGLPQFGAGVEERYDIGAVEQSRLQGRQVQVITVTPRDDFRYGYRFWIDRKTAMPIRTRLVSATGEVIEEIAFISLTLPAQVDDEMLQPDVDASGFRWLRRTPPGMEGGLAARFVPREELLPPGFRLSRARDDDTGQAAMDDARLVFTDGLAWVSVFIEPVETGRERRAAGGSRRGEGPAQMGASAAFTAQLDGYRFTAVGEVPPATVKAIAQSFRPQR